EEAFSEPARGGPYEGALSVRPVRREPDVERARGAGPRSAPPVETLPAAGPAQVNMYICEPRSFAEAQGIADRFRADTPVIMNLTGTDPDTAKRLIDFASGLTYGRDGGLQKVSERVFMLSPANVTVSAADRQHLKESGLFTYEG
ncbi:MAG: hypothetical protein C0418_02550, partial [Coriobacteriaceae bacterium]|nr:hypothetical protein [Coriobacteriaceae bacterium]